MNKEVEKTIKDFLEKTGLPFSEHSFVFDEETNSFWYNVYLSREVSLYKIDEFISSVSHLVNKIINKEEDKTKQPVFFDINGFQKRKVSNLRTVAHMMAERARFFKSSVELDPMSSYERRIVHEFLKDKENIKTESSGFGKERRVVIFYQE